MNIKSLLQVICRIAILLSFNGCAQNTIHTLQPADLPKSSELPENVEFYIKPKKNFYLPYERVELNLWMKNRGTFEKDLQIISKKLSFVQLTSLTTSNSQYTYNVNWKDIHRNDHGHSGKTTRISWFLPNDWAGLIAQVPGEYRVKFNIATPVGNWETEEFLFEIRIPVEEVLPYNDLLASRCNLFFEYEYVVRMYEKNWSTYSQCPSVKLPYEELEKFIATYPHSAFTKSLLQKLEKTVRMIKNPSTKYEVGDMDAIERILALKRL